MNAETTRPVAETRPWWLPLIVALAPLVATHLAYALSIRDGFAPACLPYWDGCTSISRAARHGDGNLVFKAVMLPCALGLGALWVQAASELRRIGVSARVMLVAGVLGALALAVYVSFLGVEGEFSRWLRRYGALIYFAATFLAQLTYVRAHWRFGARDGAVGAQLATCALLLIGGLASTVASSVVEDAALKERIENAIEWCLGALFTAWFLTVAWSWRFRSQAAPGPVLPASCPQLPPAKNRAPPPPRSG